MARLPKQRHAIAQSRTLLFGQSNRFGDMLPRQNRSVCGPPRNFGALACDAHQIQIRGHLWAHALPTLLQRRNMSDQFAGSTERGYLQDMKRIGPAHRLTPSALVINPRVPYRYLGAPLHRVIAIPEPLDMFARL